MLMTTHTELHASSRGLSAGRRWWQKILLTGVIMMLGSSAAFGFANSGPYLGVTITGENGSTWKLQNPSTNISFTASGASANIFGGYGAVFDRGLYLGAEAFWSTSNTHTDTRTVDNVGSTVKMKTSYGYGISFVPGVKTGAVTMVYGRVGLVRTRFNLTQHPAAILGTTGNTVNGTQVGVGIQTSLTKHVDIRGEYDYITYQNFTAFTNRVTPATNQFSVGLVYNFDATNMDPNWLSLAR